MGGNENTKEEIGMRLIHVVSIITFSLKKSNFVIHIGKSGVFFKEDAANTNG